LFHREIIYRSTDREVVGDNRLSDIVTVKGNGKGRSRGKERSGYSSIETPQALFEKDSPELTKGSFTGSSDCDLGDCRRGRLHADLDQVNGMADKDIADACEVKLTVK
jgi:hypothetical protein